MSDEEKRIEENFKTIDQRVHQRSSLRRRCFEQRSTLLQESKSPPLKKTNNFQSKAEGNVRKKILEAVGKDSYNGVNLFEGTKALSNSGNSSSPSAALSGVSSADPGIDISSLPGASNWGKLI